MFIDQYYSAPQGQLSFTREQGSNFAKFVAEDFNPLHDVDAKRFCIPGDLLFSVMLARYGLSQHMEFVFSGMVMDGTRLALPPLSDEVVLSDQQGREYLTVHRSGARSDDEALVQTLTRNYVKFSGHTFPDILVPLLAEQQVMINPARPMVMYQSMKIDLDTLAVTAPTLQFDHGELDVSGKRGELCLVFNLIDADKLIGRGNKRILLSGLRPYDEAEMARVVADIAQRKRSFSPA